jgi:hypothetical protein
MGSDRNWRDRMARRPSRNRALQTAACLTAVALCCGPDAANADSTPISKAETLLFMTPHLKELKPPSRLHYAFRKTGSLEKGFSDTVDIDITGGPNGSRDAVARFFSGERQLKSEKVEHAESNPVLLFYLEREIHEMSRLTGGKPDHFRHMIRLALAESAQIKNVDIRFEGRTMRAQQIAISPYDSDPNRGRFERLANKQYFFTMCETIPGVVYEMRGVVPAASGSSQDEAVVDETLTFSSLGVPQ